MIQFRCSACGMRFRTKDENAGKTRDCPRCSVSQQVPIPPVKQPVPAPGPSATRVPFIAAVSVLGSLVLLVVIVLLALRDPAPGPKGPPKQEQALTAQLPPPRPQTDEEKVRSLVESWLDEQKNG